MIHGNKLLDELSLASAGAAARGLYALVLVVACAGAVALVVILAG